MRIGKKLFPYPTLNNSKNMSCFKDCNFSLEYDDYDDNENLVLKNAHIVVGDDTISKLLDEGKLKSTVIVECSSTIYRRNFEVSKVERDITIPLNNLREQVVISCFVYANEDFTFNSSNFLEDYDGYSFDIEKYDIIAIDDGFTTRVEYDEEKDKKVSSIFTVVVDENITDKVMKIEPTSRKIIIHLPEEQFGCYENMKNNDNYRELFFSIMTVPALIFCMQNIQDRLLYNEETLDNVRIDYKWFESIEIAYKNNFNENLTDDVFKKCDIPTLSQQLMNYASVTAISDLFKQEFSKLIRGEDDE